MFGERERDSFRAFFPDLEERERETFLTEKDTPWGPLAQNAKTRARSLRAPAAIGALRLDGVEVRRFGKGALVGERGRGDLRAVSRPPPLERGALRGAGQRYKGPEAPIIPLHVTDSESRDS